MPIPGVVHPIKSREQGWDLHVIEMTVGATGAITAVDGKGMNSLTPWSATGELGGIVRDGAGLYTITLPGYGGVQKIVPLHPLVLDTLVADAKFFLLTARTASSRTFSWMCVSDAGGAEELTSGATVLFPVLVKQGGVE